MTRPRRQDARRTQIVTAAGRVLARNGLRGARLRDVAAEARLSPGSVLYYYSDFEDVLVLAIEAAVEQFYTARLRIADAVRDPRERVVRLVEAGVPDDVSEELRTVYECVGYVRQRPDLMPLLRSMTERQVGLYRATLDAGTLAGVFEPVAPIGTVARNIVALEDAYDLYALSDGTFDAPAARANILSYAASALQSPQLLPSAGPPAGR